MDARTLRVLEYDAIRQRLREQASSSLGKELAERLEPATDEATVRRLMAETTQAQAVLDHGGKAPLGGVHDVRGQVQNAARGGALSGRDLLEVADTLYASRRMRTYLVKSEVGAPLLLAHARELSVFQELEELIEGSIDSRGDVEDRASDQLARVRARVRRLQEMIERRLDGVIRSRTYARMIQEPIVTVRSGRYCVPVRSEFKGSFRGIVHDSSASGATVFMEPFVVVEVNNELREMRSEEEREVRRVLLRLSGEVGARAEEILRTVSTLGALDLIFARAGLAEAMKATEPELNTEGKIDLVEARHPLLGGRVVPVSLRIWYRVLTGPRWAQPKMTTSPAGLLIISAWSSMIFSSCQPSPALTTSLGSMVSKSLVMGISPVVMIFGARVTGPVAKLKCAPRLSSSAR